MTYTTSEFAKKLGLTAYTLRYYEKEGLLPFVERINGRRVFKDEDFTLVRTLICLKHTGMPIREIKEYMDLCQKGDCTLEQRHNIILKQKNLLEEKICSLQRNLEVLKHKEEYYQKAIEAGTENIDGLDEILWRNEKG